MSMNSNSRRPRGKRGRFIPRDCDECGCGTLQYDGDGWWSCDGLADPGHPDKPLVACTYSHHDRSATRSAE